LLDDQIMMIDTHLHPIADDLACYPISPIGGVQSEWSKGIQLTGDEILAHMDRAGVARATLVQASTVHGYDNTYCAVSCSLHPERFVGIGCIDPLAPNATDTLSDWIERWGMRGLRLFTIVSTQFPEDAASAAQRDWLDDPRTYPVWQRAEALGIPVDVQISMRGLRMVAAMLERFPNVPVLLDHLAGVPLGDGPPYAAAAPVLALSSYPNCYLKFTTNTIRAASSGKSQPQPFFEVLIRRFGADHLLWGSNFPATRGSPAAPYADLVVEARSALAFLSSDEQEQLFSGTARRLYPALDR
jgi:predicted TIM-barrel fold metal-dependent hydrolase